MLQPEEVEGAFAAQLVAAPPPPGAALVAAGGVAPAPGLAAEAAALAELAQTTEVHVLSPADVAGGATRLACPVAGCGGVFKSAPNLTVHLRSHPAAAKAHLPLPAAPAPRRGRFHCCAEGCAFGPGGRLLANLKTAVKHYTQKHAEKTLLCEHPGCAAAFAKVHQRNRHVANAHGAASCVCGTRFGSAHALRKHVRQFGASAPHAHGPATGAPGAPGGAGEAEGDGGEGAGAADAALPEALAAAPPHDELAGDALGLAGL
jgi:hypothetical protein